MSMDAREVSPSMGLPEQGAIERRLRQEAERWAGVLAQRLGSVVRDPREEPSGAAPSEGWHRRDGALTQPSSAAAAPAMDTGSDGTDARFALTVDAGELGEVELVLNRTREGVAVWIGVESSRSRDAIEPERAALAHALKNAGISVTSVQVLPSARLGTVLARSVQRRSAANGSSEPVPASGPRSKSKRLNLIG
jgi:hypothetical protein